MKNEKEKKKQIEKKKKKNPPPSSGSVRTSPFLPAPYSSSPLFWEDANKGINETGLRSRPGTYVFVKLGARNVRSVRGPRWRFEREKSAYTYTL